MYLTDLVLEICGHSTTLTRACALTPTTEDLGNLNVKRENYFCSELTSQHSDLSALTSNRRCLVAANDNNCAVRRREILTASFNGHCSACSCFTAFPLRIPLAAQAGNEHATAIYDKEDQLNRNGTQPPGAFSMN
jgi:hypothetical protein